MPFNGPGRSGKEAPNGIFGDPIEEPTPPGTIPLSQRKRAKTSWDVRAPGFESIDAWRARMTGRFNLPGQSRTNMGYGAGSTATGSFVGYNIHGTSGQAPEGFGFDPSVAMPAPVVPNALEIPAGGDAMVPGIAYSRQARRLYVGNITLEATETNVAAFFNTKMRDGGFAVDKREGAIDVQAPDPVVSVQVNHDKSYAFVEFRSPEEAQSAMGFDNAEFQGQLLKIRRPKDYQGADAMGGFMPGMPSSVPDSPNKIFIGGLPTYLTEDQVVELLNSFGELKAFNLVKDAATGASKGFAFCEYVDPSLTDVACAGLNGMELGDRYLVVQRAQAAGSAEAMSAMAPQGLMPGGLAPNSILAAAAPGAGQPSKILQMLNMCSPEDLIADEEYKDILEDTKSECESFGAVVDVKIPRPVVNLLGKIDGRASEAVKGLGRVFVVFETQEASTKCMAALAGRQFAGRTVLVAYATPEDLLD